MVQVTCENRGGKTTGGQEIYERCTCVMMGTPLEQLKVAEDLAGSGTVVVSPSSTSCRLLRRGVARRE